MVFYSLSEIKLRKYVRCLAQRKLFIELKSMKKRYFKVRMKLVQGKAMVKLF